MSSDGMGKQPPSVTFEVRLEAPATVQDTTEATTSPCKSLQRTCRRRAAIKRPLSGDEEDVKISDDSDDEPPRKSQQRVSKARATSTASAQMPTLPLLGYASSPSQQSTMGPAFIKKRSSRSATSSAFRGVTRHSTTGRYEAHLWDNSYCRPKTGRTGRTKGKQVYLGGWSTEQEAAHAYDVAAIKFWGRDASLNFQWQADYDTLLDRVEGMTRDEVIAALKRQSTGFSRGQSMYRGVTRHHQQGRWEARIGRVRGNKYLYLGTFDSEEEAARAYDVAAIQHRGKRAVTNFEVRSYSEDGQLAKSADRLPDKPSSARSITGGGARSGAQAMPQSNPELPAPETLQHVRSSPMENVLQGAALQLWSDSQHPVKTSTNRSAGSTGSAPGAVLPAGAPTAKTLEVGAPGTPELQHATSDWHACAMEPDDLEPSALDHFNAVTKEQIREMDHVISSYISALDGSALDRTP